MATGDLITLSQALLWLDETVDEGGLIASLVSGVSAQIQNFIGYQVASASYTRTFNGIGSEKIALPDRPVTAISSLTIDAIPITQGVVGSAAGFLFDTKFIYLYGGGIHSHAINRFNRGIQNVVVTYTAGFTAVPQDIQQACLVWLASAWNLVGEDASIGSLRAGDTQSDFKNTMTVLGKAVALVPPKVLSLILPYRRVAT